MRYRRWEPPVPKTLCLLVHGLAEHSGRYDFTARFLASRGHSVWMLDNRGHGQSEGLRGDCRSLDDFVEDLGLLQRLARTSGAGLPLCLVGHSLGGLIALTYAARHPGEIRAVAVSSPALKLAHETPAWKIALVTAASRVFPTAPFQNGVNPKVLCHDPAVVEAYEKDPLVHHRITARCAVSLRRSMRESLGLAEKLKIPCLILQAGEDAVCDPERAAEFSRRGNGDGITFRRYDGLYHELFNEPQREQVLGDLCRWLDEAMG